MNADRSIFAERLDAINEKRQAAVYAENPTSVAKSFKVRYSTKGLKEVFKTFNFYVCGLEVVSLLNRTDIVQKHIFKGYQSGH